MSLQKDFWTGNVESGKRGDRQGIAGRLSRGVPREAEVLKDGMRCAWGNGSSRGVTCRKSSDCLRNLGFILRVMRLHRRILSKG